MRISRTIAAAALAALAPGAFAQAPEVSLTRFECGTPRPPMDVNVRFSDTFAFPGLRLQFVYSCYLIKHGSDYLIWDTGFGADAGATAPKVTLIEHLAKSGVKPEQVKYVGISHYHADHMGGAAQFPAATLLIGKGDWEVLAAPKPTEGANPAPLKHWISGGGKVEVVTHDRDVFGDGTVILLATPGHTPGHKAAMVKLEKMGWVILSGDAAHFNENYESNGVPWFNHDRAQTLASLDRIKKIVGNRKATFIIQHDARDVAAAGGAGGGEVKYLISFPSAAMVIPEGEFEAVGNAARAVVLEAKAAGVHVFAGGIDESVPPALVSADGTVAEGGYPWAPPLNGGFTVLELPSREAALAWAARLAAACRCAQELRVFQFDAVS